jgi:uncharacterized membrane protein YphA (DoxX/SURF4 family)
VQIGVATVVMLVLLRLGLGCHFFYEGAWKIIHHDEFTARPFLTQAKGPAAGLFYAMLPDLDGKERLALPEGNSKWGFPYFRERWKELEERFAAKYGLSAEQDKQAKEVLKQYYGLLDDYYKENGADIAGYFKSLEQFEADKNDGANQTRYGKKRYWDRQQDLRRDSGKWLAYLDKLDAQVLPDLYNVLEEDQLSKGTLVARWNPLNWTRDQQLNFAVTYSLTAIGFCLILGLCTRLAALGGAGFMAFVVASQPNWPTIYPPASPEGGHALLIEKNFVELLALLLIATTAVGRWGGLDYFLYRWIGRPISNWFAQRS